MQAVWSDSCMQRALSGCCEGSRLLRAEIGIRRCRELMGRGGGGEIGEDIQDELSGQN